MNREEEEKIIQEICGELNIERKQRYKISGATVQKQKYTEPGFLEPDRHAQLIHAAASR